MWLVIRLITCWLHGILDAQASKTPSNTRSAPEGRLAKCCAEGAVHHFGQVMHSSYSDPCYYVLTSFRSTQ